MNNDYTEQDRLIRTITDAIESIRYRRKTQYNGQSHPAGKRFTQEELTEFAYPSYKNLLQGRTRHLPDRAIMLRIADYLECSLTERNGLLHAAQYAPDIPRIQKRKQVTVVIADLSQSPVLAVDQDVEESAFLVQTIWQQADSVIQSFEGVTIRSDGTRLMAVWSVYNTYERDPESAVRAALELQSMVARFASEHSLNLVLRIGIHTGVALVGPNATSSELDVIGQTIAIASRLQEQATDRILISQSTYRHVHSAFSTQPISRWGFPRLPSAYQVIDRSPRAVRFGLRSFDHVETPLVGRDPEIKRLQALFTQSIAESRLNVITINADVGLGKSRLIYEFVQWAKQFQPETTVLYARTGPSSSTVVNILLCELFVNYLPLLDDDSTSSVRRKFERAFMQAMGHKDEVRIKARLVCYFLGYSPISEDIQPFLHDARILREHVVRILCEFFVHLSNRVPLLIVLEDLQWSDTSSLELLNIMFRQLSEQSVCVVSTARPVIDETYPRWGSDSFHQRIGLAPLNEHDSRLLTRHLLHKVPDVPESFITFVTSRAEGNPLYTEELIKMLIDQGVIEGQEGRWRITKQPADSLPTTVISILQSRYEMLPDSERRILQAAAVIGRTFWNDGMFSLLDNSELPKNVLQKQVTMALDFLERRDIILRQLESTFRTIHEYQFKHHLMHATVYESILKRDRAQFHSRAADWLMRSIKEGIFSQEYGSLVAEHYRRAEMPAQAVEWFYRTGDYAIKRYAHHLAIDLFTEALNAGQHLSPEEQRILISVRISRAHSYQVTGNKDLWREDIEALQTAVKDTDDSVLIVRAAVMSAEYQAQNGTLEQAVAAVQYAAQLAQTHQLIEAEIECTLMHAKMRGRRGEVIYARDLCVKALQLARKFGAAALENNALHMLAAYSNQLGEWKQAQTYAQQALRLARRRRDPVKQGWALRELGHLAFRQQKGAEARSYYMQSLDLQTTIGDQYGTAVTRMHIGSTFASTGEHRMALEYFSDALEQAQQLGDNRLVSHILIFQGTSQLALGMIDNALEHLQMALTYAQTYQDEILATLAYEGIARAFDESGKTVQAVEAGEIAADTAERLHIPEIQRIAYETLVQLLTKMGRSTDALPFQSKLQTLATSTRQPHTLIFDDYQEGKGA